MKYQVISNRLGWPAGSTVDSTEIEANIDALVSAGHLREVKEQTESEDE